MRVLPVRTIEPGGSFGFGAGAGGRRTGGVKVSSGWISVPLNRDRSTVLLYLIEIGL